MRASELIVWVELVCGELRADQRAAIERLCQIEERGKGVLNMPRAERQVAVSAGLKRKWKERRSGNASQ